MGGLTIAVRNDIMSLADVTRMLMETKKYSPGGSSVNARHTIKEYAKDRGQACERCGAVSCGKQVKYAADKAVETKV